MKIFKYKIKGNKIIHLGEIESKPMQNNINYFKLKFKFDEDWKDLVKYIQFKFKGISYQYEFDEYDEDGFYDINIPSFILEGKGFKFTLIGTNNDLRIITETKNVDIHLNEYTKDISPVNPDVDPEDIFTKIFTELNKKQNKEEGKGLSTNDFTNGLLNKLNNIEDYATHNIIDVNLSNDSENAVQNKIINGELYKKIEDNDLGLLLINITEKINSL